MTEETTVMHSVPEEKTEITLRPEEQIAFLKEYLSLRLDALDAFFPGE